ncbi:uncharacterized protein LOC111870286 [Cryptotermes secundus]|uniref:uncharacterized protein LOC111870286 n=1 Tax=Cryptotermes secundus TaxID=105785 RepID=UPI000CD7CE2F|nr:uncharacterized protein LOC111870286 [Cryptotermes secundus]
MIWDSHKVKCLIEEYREKSILWDLRHPNYKDNRKKVKLWEDLATKFQCSVKEVKEKVKNLRTTFHRYKKKNRGSAKGDQWVHFPSLSFLLEVDAPKRELSTEEDIVSENEDTKDHEIGPNSSETQLHEAVRSQDDRHEETVRPQSTPEAAGREFVTPTSGTKKRRRQGIDRDEEAGRSDETYEVLKKASQRDEFATYGEYVANELRKLSLPAQTIAKYHINNILFHAAMGKYDMPPQTHRFTYSPQSSHSSPQTTPSPDHSPYHEYEYEG